MAGGTTTGRETYPYCSWNINTNRYFREEIRKDLVKILEETNIKNRFLSKTKFKGEGVQVIFDYDKIGGWIKIDLYANNNERGKKIEEIIQKQIDINYQKNLILSSRYEKKN